MAYSSKHVFSSQVCMLDGFTWAQPDNSCSLSDVVSQCRHLHIWGSSGCQLGTYPSGLSGHWLEQLSCASCISHLLPSGKPDCILMAKAEEWAINSTFFNCFSSRVVSIFTPPCPLPHPSPSPTLSHTPFGFVHVAFIHGPWWPFPYYPSPPSSLDKWSKLGSEREILYDLT